MINRSAGFSFSDYISGKYGIHERWLDHVAVNHSVRFVISAGNKEYDEETGEDLNPNDYINRPATAYNAISVGYFNDKNTLNQGDDELCAEPLWRKTGYAPNKPDLIAPENNIKFSRFSISETSAAAPHVTAVVAQLCQRRPALKVKQDGVKAILTASINHSDLVYTPADTAYEKCGAGAVDARSAFYTSDNYRFSTSTFAANSAANSSKTYTFNVSSTDERVRVSLCWLKYSSLTGSHNDVDATDFNLANLDLFVYAPNGTLVGKSDQALYENTEIVEFDPNGVTGNYRAVVKQTGNSNRAVYYGIAWW